MEMGRGFQPKKNMVEQVLNGGGGGRTTECKFVIKLPHSRVLRVISRSFLLALAIFTLPWFGSIIMGSSTSFRTSVVVSEPMNGGLLPILIKDLINEGLLKSGDKALLFSSEASFNEASFRGNLHFLNDNGMNLVSETDIERQNWIPDEALDFVLVSGFGTVTFLDRIVKTGGIAVVQLNDAFQKPNNYRMEYVRRFDSSTIVALRKTGPSDDELSTTKRPTSRRLYGFQFDVEAKKEALKGLEDALLEPPRASSSMENYSKRTKFLPNLMGDSLEGYSRRVFIDVGSTSGAEWFEKYYPKNNKEFEMYKLDFETEDLSGKATEKQHQIGMSDWLKKNVKEEEYVVMKAESEVVEEMMKNKAISLVDELFLECKHQWQGEKQQHQQQQQNKKRTRAYWECLALYGRLRDEGVAVHQWWG